MGKFLILSVADHEEHILNKIIETIANEPELDHKGGYIRTILGSGYKFSSSPF